MKTFSDEWVMNFTQEIIYIISRGGGGGTLIDMVYVYMCLPFGVQLRNTKLLVKSKRFDEFSWNLKLRRF